MSESDGDHGRCKVCGGVVHVGLDGVALEPEWGFLHSKCRAGHNPFERRADGAENVRLKRENEVLCAGEKVDGPKVSRFRDLEFAANWRERKRMMRGWGWK